MAGPATKMVTGAGKAWAAEPIEVSSLMGALEDILDVPVGRRAVKVQALQVQHAAALAEMFQFQTSGRRWRVEAFRKLKRFGSADAVLVILDDALLPVLAKDPTSARALDLLERYGNRLHTLSVSVGGTFEEEVDILHQDLIRHVEEARMKPLTAISELVASSDSIRARISTLRRQVVGIGDHVLSEGDNDDDADD